VVAPIPGLVVSVEVAPGQEVPAGAVLLILEAMKMHSEIRAPAAGRVAAVRVRAGQEVAGGAVLAVLEPTA
jgi:biotin carboxyl carrier protein